MQIAKSLGAEVTAVCSTRHVDKVRSIGADEVVDYTKDDFAQRGKRYDIVLDLVGNRSLSDCKSVLNSKGVYVASAGEPPHAASVRTMPVPNAIASSRIFIDRPSTRSPPPLRASVGMSRHGM